MVIVHITNEYIATDAFDRMASVINWRPSEPRDPRPGQYVFVVVVVAVAI